MALPMVSTEAIPNQGMTIRENISTWNKVKRKDKKKNSQALILKPVETYNRFDILENETCSVEDVNNVIPEKMCKPLKMKKQKLSNKTEARLNISASEFTNLEQKKSNVKGRFFTNVFFTSFLLTQIKEKDVEGRLVRCLKCWINHFPHPKFCRWTRSLQEKKEDTFTNLIVTDELKQKIEKHVVRIERSEKNWEDLLIDVVSPDRESSPQFPDIILESMIPKLKGGAKIEKVKKIIHLILY